MEHEDTGGMKLAADVTFSDDDDTVTVDVTFIGARRRLGGVSGAIIVARVNRRRGEWPEVSLARTG